MNPERWHRVEDLFHQALEREGADRSRFLDQQCSGDPELRREVDRLLDASPGAPAAIAAAVGAAVRSLHAPLSPGTRIGPYQILALHGEGGMGSVYRARRDDDVFRKEVAIKVVKRGIDSGEILERFRRERRILARLEHPFIARVLDGGSTEDGRPYLVMEYVDGQNLLDFARERHLGLTERLRLFSQVCEAVAHAHQHGVVHRDLKPGNVLVDAQGRPRLLDFGIARLPAVADPDVPATTGVAGMLTPRYASPEHVKGEEVTARSDVYSLGAILYELLSGTAAHRLAGDSPAAIVKAICDERPTRPSVAVSQGAGRRAVAATDLDGDLERIVMTALEKDPARRYESAQALADDLRRWSDRVPLAGPPAVTRRRRAAMFAATGAAVAAALIAAAYLRHEPKDATRVGSRGRVVLAALPIENLTGSDAQDYFIDGLHEEIVSRLGRLQPDRLGVIARTSTLQYKDTQKPIAAIGRDLGAQYLLQGSVRQAGERVRVNVRLIQVSDQAHVWVETFDRELRDLFSVQVEIGARVADSLELEVLPEAFAAMDRPAQLSPDAFTDYLRGRYYWQRRWLDFPLNLHRAIDHFERSVTAAPAYAPGHAALGEAYQSSSIYSAPSERKALREKARASVSKALLLDAGLANARATLALIHLQDWDWAGAEQELRQAVRLDRNFADVHQYLALLLAYTGRHEEAAYETRLGRELDPLSPSLHKLAFFVHLAGRRWDSARETIRTLSELAPADSAHVYFSGLMEALEGDCTAARRELAKRAPMPIGAGNTDEEYVAAYVTGRCAPRDEAARFTLEMERRPGYYAQTIAIAYAGAGNSEKTLTWLEESYRRRESLLFFLAADPTLEFLRDEPRYRALLQQMRLPQQ